MPKQLPSSSCHANNQLAFRDVLHRLGLQNDIMASLSAEERAVVMKAGGVRKFSSGEPVFLQGTGHNYTYIILKGVVRTTYLAHNSKEYIVSYWKKGDIVGGPYFFEDDTIYLWSGHAAESVEALAISGNLLRDLAFRIPALAVAMLNALSVKIHWFSLLLQVMGTQSAKGRLGMLLLGLGTAYGAETPTGLMLRHTFTQADLAKMIGVSRQWVNNALGDFQKQGALKIVKGRFLIKKPSLLMEAIVPSSTSE